MTNYLKFFRLSLFLVSIFSLTGSSLVFSLETVEELATPLVPRSTFFSDPNHTSVQISPDGQWLSYLAPHQGVLNIWVGDPKNLESMHPITTNSKRGIAGYIWAYTNRHIIYVDDFEGNEDWRIYRVDVVSGEKLTLASFNKVQARLAARSENHPEEILVELNQRRPDLFDIYRLNILSGKLTPVMENNTFADFVYDHDLNVKVGMQTTPDGGAQLYTLNKDAKNEYVKKELFSIPQQDMLTTSPLSMDKTGDILYMIDSRKRNTGALFSLNLKSKKTHLMSQDKRVDIDNVLTHPTKKTVQATSATYEKTEWTILDKTIAPDFKYLKTVMEGELHITSRSLDDNTWIVVYDRDNGAPHYYLYDRPSQKARFLFPSRPELDNVILTNMDPVIIKSRDNLSLVSYLSLPYNLRMDKAKIETPVPLILLVHGGPAARDSWGYDAEHQWLTNRGYAVLSVNYRGSTGFGKKFANAGNGEWAAKMHDDLIDAVNWAIQQGITTSDKVAIMGGSYGGYATLVGMTKTPDVFACGVDIVGMSNLETMFQTIPEYWKPMYTLLKIMVGGDPETEVGRQFLASRSPLTFVDNIKKPLLIGQGANDPRVKQAQSDQIVKVMESKKIPVTYVLYPDEGHGFAKPENRLSFYAVTESFLAKNLGGRFEPINDAFKNSSIEIKAGKQEIPGLVPTSTASVAPKSSNNNKAEDCISSPFPEVLPSQPT